VSACADALKHANTVIASRAAFLFPISILVSIDVVGVFKISPLYLVG
jgi:hypothetical protein